mgnify:CR=1 FL=1
MTEKNQTKVIFVETDFEPICSEKNPFVKGWDTSPDVVVNKHEDKQQGESIFKLIYEKTRGVVLSKKGGKNERKI